jgi:Holliday junction resolvase-like predicted endonuclease
MPKNEPEPLRRGKEFHKKIQKDWLENGQGWIKCERIVLKTNNRKGRVDIFVDDEEPEGTIALVEIKASDWDRMTDKAVRRNARRQIKQIWDYIETQIKGPDYVSTGEKKSVCPGIIFPKRPKNEERMKLIETMFMDEGIPVVWNDESLEECKKRNQIAEEDIKKRP